MSQLALALPTPISLARPQRVALFDPADRFQAERRLAVIRPALEFQDDPRRFGMLRLRDQTPVTSYSKMVAFLAETSGVSSRTLFNWLREYRAGGLPALADRQRADKGQSRFFKTYPKAAWTACYLFFGDPDAPDAVRRFQGQSVRICHEAILRNAEPLGIPPEELPSYETVRAYLASMPPSLTVYSRLGKKAYRERMSPYLRRAYTDVFANQVWVGDSRKLDIEAANDCFEGAEYMAPVRIQLTAMIDYRSRLFIGESFCWDGSSLSIGASIRRGITKYGPPELFYFDNGKDFRKIARGARPGYQGISSSDPAMRLAIDAIETTGFAARIGAGITHCLPHHPQAKGIERFFLTMKLHFDGVWPTFTGGTPETRPEFTERAMVSHRRLIKTGRAAESQHPRASEVIKLFVGWIEEYNDTPHSGEGMDGGTPRQVFEANLNPAQKPTPEPATLALLMAERETRSVRECAVTLKNKRYVPADQTGWAVMHEFNERDVLVVYDPADLGNVAALDRDGVFLAWLEQEQLTRFAPYDKRTQLQIADSMATRRRLEKGNRETLALISQAARQNGAQSPLEAMVTRLQLPAGESGRDLITQRKPRLAPPNDETQNLNPGDAADRMIAGLRRSKNGAARS